MANIYKTLSLSIVLVGTLSGCLEGPALKEGSTGNHDGDINAGESVAVGFKLEVPSGKIMKDIAISFQFPASGSRPSTTYNKSISEVRQGTTITLGEYALAPELKADDTLSYTASVRYAIDGQPVTHNYSDSLRVLHPCSGSAPYDSGTGTFSDPYLICRSSQLQRLAATPTDWSKDFKLTRSLDFNTLSFTPIGNNATPFSGEFNGNGFTISNLKVGDPAMDFVGLFGKISGAFISDLSLVGGKRTGHFWTGGVVGQSASSYIKNVSSLDEVIGARYVGGIVGTSSNDAIRDTSSAGATGSDFFVGGIAGFFYSSSIEHSTSYGNVSGYQSVGGIVGYCNTGAIYESSSEGALVKGNSAVGGIAGTALACTTENAFNRANVDGTDYVGGIFGNFSLDYAGFLGAVRHVYSTGAVLGGVTLDDYIHRYKSATIGKIQEIITDGSRFESVLYDQDAAASLYVPGATTGLSTASMKDLNFLHTYYGFNTSIWAPGAASVNDGYPTLR